MISTITGKITDIDSDNKEITILTASGVGYLVNIVDGQFLPDQETTIYISTVVSDTQIKLWGFVTQLDLRIFRLLLTVGGVGPSSAAALVHGLGARKIITSIMQKNADGLKVSGVGLKTSQKIIIDLYAKVEKSPDLQKFLIEGATEVKSLFSEAVAEATAALVGLGYNKSLVQGYFMSAALTGETSELISQFLKDNS